jgi:predicted GH43/DUF377 family glycosyl hydrolase
MKLDMPEEYFNFDLYNKSEKDTADTVYIWGKDAVLFPKKINGKFAMLHRVLPNIHIAYFKNFKELTHDYWEDHFKHLSDFIVLDKRHWFESRALGAGAPPIETKKGWLMIYHAIENAPEGWEGFQTLYLALKKNGRKKEMLIMLYFHQEQLFSAKNFIFIMEQLIKE